MHCFCNKGLRFLIASDNKDLAAQCAASAKRGDSGIDLAVSEIKIPKDTPTRIPLGCRVRCICVECGSFRGFWLLPRSSFSKTPLRAELNLDLHNVRGLIDAGYVGELQAAVFTSTDFKIAAGTALFQIVAPDLRPAAVEIITLDDAKKRKEFIPTERNDSGFGSTG